MNQNLIKTLLSNLPRFAEEEGDFYSVSREELTNALCLNNEVSRDVAENTIELIENLLNSLSVLNSDYLQKGEWCFVSFPAQLLAMSILTAMSDNESYFFAKNFWNTNGISSAKKNEQRAILNYIETNRITWHDNQSATPIRHIYVAWGIIKLDNQILLYQREDTHKRHDKSAGDYGLIGGRLNQNDMEYFSGNIKARLQVLQSDNVELIKEFLPVTLKRELQEETGLIFEEHYTFKKWRVLKPYFQVQGAAPNHAYTQYHLEIFNIDLTLEGYLFLQQKIEFDERLVWFSIDELTEGENIDGKLAYTKALVKDFDDKIALKNALNKLQNSFESDYLFSDIDDELMFFLNTENFISFGKKQQNLGIKLTNYQQQILLGLAAHNRKFFFDFPNKDIVFHQYGWIEVKNESKLKEELLKLSNLSYFKKLKIENKKDKFFRLSVEPSIIYFDPQLFCYEAPNTILKTENKIFITRKSFKTAFGETKKQTEEFSITGHIVEGLKSFYEVNPYIYEKDGKSINYKDRYEAYRKSFMKKHQNHLALNKLVIQEDNRYKFCVIYGV